MSIRVSGRALVSGTWIHRNDLVQGSTAGATEPYVDILEFNPVRSALSGNARFFAAIFDDPSDSTTGETQGTYRGSTWNYIDDYIAVYEDSNRNQELDPSDRLISRFNLGIDWGGLGDSGATGSFTLDPQFNMSLQDRTGGSLGAARRLPLNPFVSAASLAISAASADQAEGNSRTTRFTFTVSRSGNTAGVSSVSWAVTGSGPNPATAADFSGARLPAGTVRFAAGQTSQTITVNLAGDRLSEADETFAVTLSNAGKAVISTASATGTIRNDDLPTSPSAAPTLAMTSEYSSQGVTLSRSDFESIDRILKTIPADSLTWTTQGPSSPFSGLSYSLSRQGSGVINGNQYYLELNFGTTSTAPGKTLVHIFGRINDARVSVTLLGNLQLTASGLLSGTADTIVYAFDGQTPFQTAVVSGLNLQSDDFYADYLNGRIPAAQDLVYRAGLNLSGSAFGDSLSATAYADVIDGRTGQDSLTGHDGADLFAFRFGDSQISAPDRITDFAFATDRIRLLAASGDPLIGPTAVSRAANNHTARTLTDLVNAVFTDANGSQRGSQTLGSNQAALVVATHADIAGTYLIINDSTAGFSAESDLLINLSGYRGTLPGVGAVTPSAIFS